MVVTIGDEGSTLCCTISYRDGEVDALEELFYLLIEGSTTYDNLIGLAAKGCIYLLTDAL